MAAHLHLSWLDPHKERRFTVVGSRRMATFDDMAIEQKLTVYDKGVRPALQRATASTSPAPGDVWSPSVPNDEPLRLECSHFVECVREGAAAALRRESGLRVVRVLEELQRSLDAGAPALRPPAS